MSATSYVGVWTPLDGYDGAKRFDGLNFLDWLVCRKTQRPSDFNMLLADRPR